MSYLINYGLGKCLRSFECLRFGCSFNVLCVGRVAKLFYKTWTEMEIVKLTAKCDCQLLDYGWNWYLKLRCH